MIGFVFCILAALALGAILDLEKQLGAHRLRSSYLGNLAANRQILDQTTSDFYASLKADRSKVKEEETREKKGKKPEIPAPPPVNAPCARLNLDLLIENGSVQEPALYEMAAKLLRSFYGETLFEKRPRAEYKFLDSFLVNCREQKCSILEKLSFKDQKEQMLYYKMLKGTKKNNLLKGIGYPSLLDYVKIEQAVSKICLFHAHPNLIAAFFTPKGAAKLYEALHLPNAPLVTKEVVERICHEVHAPLLDEKIFDFFEMEKHTQSVIAKTTLVGEDRDSHIFLRKVVHSPKGKESVNELPIPR
jgi:hypothetical protein